MTALTLLALLAGCSDASDSSSSTPETASSASASPRPQQSESSPTGSTQAPSTSETLGPVTGSKTITGDANTARTNPVSVRLDFHGLHRDGKLLRLDYSVTSLETTDERFYIPDVLKTNSNEVVLLDTTRLKKYLVVEDSEKQSLFTAPNVYLVDSQRFEGAAYFAAPPPEVTELDLVFASYGRFKTPVTG